VCCLAAIEMQQLGISTKKEKHQTMPILQQKHDKIVGIIE
jgi:hypothetical protein